jgi:hypothetical protein
MEGKENKIRRKIQELKKNERGRETETCDGGEKAL